MPPQLLNLVSENFLLLRNQPRMLQFAGQTQGGSQADFNDCIGARLRITHLYGIDAASIIADFNSGFVANGPFQQRTWTAEEIANLPIGEFLYEFQVSWVLDEWVTSHQGNVTIGVSTYSLNEVAP